mmetsp:Transcript_59178/g.95653  ORF Transcript_59178/g.95653 Transcript_59178/m.95653 type:complete len:130 (-) Transcript_59178:190-579(-)
MYACIYMHVCMYMHPCIHTSQYQLMYVSRGQRRMLPNSDLSFSTVCGSGSFGGGETEDERRQDSSAHNVVWLLPCTTHISGILMYTNDNELCTCCAKYLSLCVRVKKRKCVWRWGGVHIFSLSLWGGYD